MKSRLVFAVSAVVWASSILPALTACNSVGAVPQNVDRANSPPPASPVPQAKTREGDFAFANLYWAHPMPVLKEDWHAVFGGTVVRVKTEKQEYSGGMVRKYKTGELKVERVFLDLPTGGRITPGSVFFGESFDGLKPGDKVIVFINAFYEKDFVQVNVAGTNTRLGFKVKTWNDPIVAAIEKTAPCAKIRETTPEGHGKDFSVRLYDCRMERDRAVLENKELAEIWRRYDPEGFQYLLDTQEFRRETGK